MKFKWIVAMGLCFSTICTYGAEAEMRQEFEQDVATFCMKCDAFLATYAKPVWNYETNSYSYRQLEKDMPGERLVKWHVDKERLTLEYVLGKDEKHPLNHGALKERMGGRYTKVVRETVRWILQGVLPTEEKLDKVIARILEEEALLTQFTQPLSTHSLMPYTRKDVRKDGYHTLGQIIGTLTFDLQAHALAEVMYTIQETMEE